MSPSRYVYDFDEDPTRPVAERLGLDPTRRIGDLSRGNKQKVGLARAFAHEPELLILDEPTSGLDPLVQQEFHAMVAEAAARGQTIFLSSHVMSEPSSHLTSSRIVNFQVLPASSLE